jgi:hypothetical protein
MTRALVASAFAAVALAAAPAGALAQDAGGQQYDDPLADTPTAPSTPSTPSAPTSPSTGSTASAGGTGTASPSTGTTAAAPGSEAAAAATVTPSGEIPRTGFPVGWLAFSGFLALGSGFALRRAAGFQGI